MRFADRAGKYRRKYTQRLSTSLPNRAAAVMVHDKDGSVATLCLDLDTSKAAQSVVDADARRISALLTSCGLRFIADHSPSGGRHIYIPLTTRLAAEDAREIVEALCLQFSSLDPGPHQNITEGCIRPPGSLHKSGRGHQELDTPLSLAYDIGRRRNGAEAVALLRSALADGIKQLHAGRQVTAPVPGPAESRRRAHTPSPKGAALLETARTGIWDRVIYKSPSEARLAVLTHLANTGITLSEIEQRLAGEFAGLATLYKTPKNAARLLPYEWAKAQRRVAENPAAGKPGKPASLNYDTEPAPTHGGGPTQARSAASVLQEINDLENVLYALLDQRLAKVGREGISLRFLLRSVIGFARMKKSLVIDVGCRSFALAMGKHHATIARLLPLLERHTEGLVERIEFAHGKSADVYLLTLPKQWAPVADAASWRKGKIHGIRSVFWALGDVAALVYEAIERQRTPSTAADLVRETGIGRTAVDNALKVMAGHSMIERRHGTWRIRRTTNLDQVAHSLGLTEDYEERLRRVQAERRQWQLHLERFTQPPVYEEDLYDVEKDEYYSLPPDPGGGPDPFHRHLAAA